MSSLVFDTYSHYYDLLYADKDYVSETNYMQSLLASNGIKKGSLLEFGSGTGKHGNLLANMGFKVHGIEQSFKMVARALVNDGFTCQQGDLCEIRLQRKFDAVLSFFHVFSYQTTHNEVLAFLSTAHSHLELGGILIFDFWYSPAVMFQMPEVRVKKMADTDVEITRIAEPINYPDRNIVDVNYTIFSQDLKKHSYSKVTETHSMRHFSLPEIDALAQLTGFERLGAEEFMSGAKTSEKTWSVCVILKKID